jgi:hypothetical protein
MSQVLAAPNIEEKYMEQHDWIQSDLFFAATTSFRTRMTSESMTLSAS